MTTNINLCDYIRAIPDFPKTGIVFRDITPLVGDGEAFAKAIASFAKIMPDGVDSIVGIESRGFIFGAALAQATGLGLTIVRKPGKLPDTVHTIEYELEYGVDRLEIHRDALSAGHKVVIVDDLLATGGTACATVELVRQLGAEVLACLFLINLESLPGKERLTKMDVDTRNILNY
ncbi:MAG: adenine phosphoribosyltransferase [Mariprofundales bacterium]